MEKRNISPVILPDAFTRRMQDLLGGEYDDFIASYDQPARHGLRLNRLKTTAAALEELLPFPLTPVPWCADGFIYPSHERPAKNRAYHAGLFYIQEPSAMSPAAVLNAQPDEYILDLCAAPGGKSAQIAGGLNGRGLLVSNDASASRCGALLKNLELAGVRNNVVLNEQPKRLADRFSSFFDGILVDAPCSGEGMFRRDPDAVKGWAANKPEACARMQREILHYAAMMLKPGGRLVYSTCTFNPDENEHIIEAFLTARPDFILLPIPHEKLGLSPGLGLPDAARIWPHHASGVGEGHFIALLQRKAGNETDPPLKARRNTIARSELQAFKRFAAAYMRDDFERSISGVYQFHEQSLFLTPEALPDLRGLRVMRGGWYLGDISKDRFMPSQALAMGFYKQDARFSLELTPEDAERYLRGESLPLTIDGFTADSMTTDGEKPYALICADGHPLGWGRVMNERVKNLRPTGWAVRG